MCQLQDVYFIISENVSTVAIFTSLEAQKLFDISDIRVELLCKHHCSKHCQ